MRRNASAPSPLAVAMALAVALEIASEMVVLVRWDTRCWTLVCCSRFLRRS
jgi:hypothetical protein